MVKGRNMSKTLRRLLCFMTLYVIGMCTGLQAQAVPIKINVRYWPPGAWMQWEGGTWVVPQKKSRPTIDLTIEIQGERFFDRADVIGTREVAGRTVYLCNNGEAFQLINDEPIPVFESKEAIQKPELTTAIQMLKSPDATSRTQAAWAIWKRMSGQELPALRETRKTESPQTNVQPLRLHLTVKQLQAKLKQLGYDPGPSDGVLGGKTLIALKKFQTDHGLAGTGKLDQATINKLLDKSSEARPEGALPSQMVADVRDFTALSQRLRSGDPTALQALVLSARPPNRPLSWTFTLPLQGAEAKTLIAYSLQVAQAKVQEAAQQRADFRQSLPDVWHLGGITKPWAFEVDPQANDLILVGERESQGLLTLDDLVVALRIQNTGEWPDCRVDPPPTASEPSQLAPVVFTKGLDNTHFGQVCFEAYRLVGRLALGLEQPRLAVFQAYADLVVAVEHTSEAPLPWVRFWLAPLPRIAVRENLVLLTEFRLSVFTAVIAPHQFEYRPATQFAQTMGQRYGELGQAYEPFASFDGLWRLTSLSRGLAEAAARPDLRYWLEHYHTIAVETPREVLPLRVVREVTGQRLEVQVW